MTWWWFITVAALAATGLLLGDYMLWRRGRRRVRRLFAIASTPSGELPYLDIGPPEGPPVLVSSGGGAGIDSALGLTWLTAAGFRVIAIARPGYHGVPLDAAPSLEAQADQYAATLAAIGVTQPVHVFGISAGGPTALHYAARHRTRSLLLWCAITGPYTPNQEALDSPLGRLILSPHGQTLISWLLSRSARWAPHATMRTFLKTESRLSDDEIAEVTRETLSNPERLERFRRFVDSTTPMTDLYVGMMNEVQQMAEPWSVDWASIGVPTLAVASTVDRDVSPDHIARLERSLAHASILTVRAGGHFVWWGAEGEDVIRESLAHLRAADSRTQ